MSKDYSKLERLLDYALIRFKNKNNWVLYGVVIGSMASGKTTLALTLASLFSRKFNGKCYITSNLDNLDIVKDLQGKHIALIFDDVSNKLKKYSDHLTKIFTIRHLPNSPLQVIDKNIFLLFVCHYLRSIAPFLRSAPVRFLTSISESEIRAYSSEYLFTISALWDYFHYYVYYPSKYIVLANVYAREHILDVTDLTLSECEEI